MSLAEAASDSAHSFYYTAKIEARQVPSQHSFAKGGVPVWEKAMF